MGQLCYDTSGCKLTSLDIDLLDVVVEYPSRSPILRLNAVLGQIVFLGCVHHEHGRVVVREFELDDESCPTSTDDD